MVRWLRHPFFHLSPPKSTGREMFGGPYLERLWSDMDRRRLDAFDRLATLTELTARSVALNYRAHLDTKPDDVVLCGGGAEPSLASSHREGAWRGVRRDLLDDLRGGRLAGAHRGRRSVRVAGAGMLGGAPGKSAPRRPALVRRCAVDRSHFREARTRGVAGNRINPVRPLASWQVDCRVAAPCRFRCTPPH